MSASVNAAHKKLDHACECGHPRRAHVDAYQRCDHGDLCACRFYRGRFEPLPSPGVYWSPRDNHFVNDNGEPVVVPAAPFTSGFC